MNKLGQIKFGESIGVIIIVYIVIMVGFIWYNNVNSDNLVEIYEKDQQNRAFEKYHNIVNNHLIHSSQLGYIDEELDLYSLYTMKNYTQTKEGKQHLNSFLGNSLITVKLYDINMNSIKNITIYNNSKPEIEYNLEFLRTLITVKDEINEKNLIGILELVHYEPRISG